MFDLIAAFDDPHGVNQNGYHFARDYIKLNLGRHALGLFLVAVHVQDNRYYIKEDNTAKGLYEAMLIAGKVK